MNFLHYHAEEANNVAQELGNLKREFKAAPGVSVGLTYDNSIQEFLNEAQFHSDEAKKNFKRLNDKYESIKNNPVRVVTQKMENDFQKANDALAVANEARVHVKHLADTFYERSNSEF